MPARYYLPPAGFAGIADFLVNFAATRKAKEQAESRLQAQASAQQNQALAGAVGNVTGASIGALTMRGKAFADLTPVQKLAMMSSFMPGGGQIGQMAGRMADMEAMGTRQDAAIQAASNRQAMRAEYDRAQSADELYLNRYGQLPPVTAETFESQFGQMLPPPDAVGPVEEGGVPLPTINPSATTAYRKAQQAVAAYDANMDRPMPPDERAAIQQAHGQRIDQMRRMIKSAQPPKAPTTYEELVAAGPLQGGLARTPWGEYVGSDGKGGVKIMTGTKDLALSGLLEDRNNYINMRMATGATPLEAAAEYNRKIAEAQVVPIDLPNGIKGTAIVDPKTGEVTFDEANRGTGEKEKFDFKKEYADAYGDMTVRAYDKIGNELPPKPPTPEQLEKELLNRRIGAQRSQEAIEQWERRQADLISLPDDLDDFIAGVQPMLTAAPEIGLARIENVMRNIQARLGNDVPDEVLARLRILNEMRKDLMAVLETSP